MCFISPIILEIVKIFIRLRLRFYLMCLRNIKTKQIHDKFKLKIKKKPKGCDEILLSSLKEPFVLIKDFIMMYVSMILELFMTDSHPSYLKLTLKKGCKENHLLKQSAIYLFGLCFSIAYFYVQIFVLEKFGNKIYVFTIIVLATTAIFPLMYKTAFAIALLVIPSTGTMTVRAILVGIILFDLQVIAWSNINYNFDNIGESISCETNAFKNIAFRFKNKQNKKKGDVGLKKGSALDTFRGNIKKLIKKLKEVFKSFVGIFRGLTDMALHIFKPISDQIKSFLDFGILKPIQYYIQNLIDKIVDIVVNFVKTILEPFLLKMKEQIIKTGKEVLEKLKAILGVKYHSNYVHNTTSNRNTTFKQIFADSKQTLMHRYRHVATIIEAIKAISPLFIVYAFLKIFGSAVLFYVRFLYTRGVSNHYITYDFLRYNKELMLEGKDSLFPFYDFEHGSYTGLYDIQITDTELISMVAQLTLDLIMLCYITTLLLVDLAVYGISNLIRTIAIRIADDIMSDSADVRPTKDFCGMLTADGSTFLNDFSLYQEQIKECAPNPAPVEYPIYRKCLWFLLFQVTVTCLNPYIKRTRVILMSKMYPERIRVRSVWLYNHIKFMRIIIIIKTLIMDPQTGWVQLIKQGSNRDIDIDDDDQVDEKEKQEKEKEAKAKLKLKAKKAPLPRINKFMFVDTIAIHMGIKQALPKCSFCNKITRPKDKVQSCQNWQCPAIYCIACYATLGYRCCKCFTEADLNNLKSEEKDSSLEWYED